MKKRLGVMLIIILVAIAVTEFILPLAAGRLVAGGIADVFKAKDVNAQLTKKPAIAMLSGNFDRIAVQAKKAKIDKLTFDELNINLEEAKLDIQTLLSQHTLVFESARKAELEAVLTQEELAAFLNQSVKGVKDADVKVENGKVRVTGNYALASFASLAITLDGRIIGDGQKLKFVTDRFLLNNTAVGNIGGALLAEIKLADLSKLPLGVDVRTVSMENGKVTVHADNLQ